MTLESGADNAAALEPKLLGQVTLDPLTDPRLRLRVRESIAVKVLEESGQIIAAAEELNEYGSGDSQAEAITELQYAIADLYFSLEEDKDRLGPGLQKVWDILQVKIEQR